MDNTSTPAGDGAGIVVVTVGKRVFGLSAQRGKVLWQCDELSQSPRIEVVGDRVIVAGYPRLLCLRSCDGSVEWRQEPPFVVATLLCANDQILVGGSGEVACYAADGRLLWHEPFKGKGMGHVALAVPGKASQVDHSE